MRLSLALFVLSASSIAAFSSVFGVVRKSTVLSASSSSAAAATIAKARKAAGLPVEEEAPPLFSDNLLEDMRTALLLLEKRVKDGPGAMTHLEVDEFQTATDRIYANMKEQAATLASRPKPGERVVELTANPPPGAELAYDDEVPEMVVSPKVTQVLDTSNDEGPAYTGKGGMGLAQGTTNTYVIPGMDEMSPEEYQKALQDSISERQRNRHKKGIYGNRATWDYLNHLNGDHHASVLKEGSATPLNIQREDDEREE